MIGLRDSSSAALILGTRTFSASSLSTAGRSGATFTPPPQFFEGAKFDVTLALAHGAHVPYPGCFQKEANGRSVDSVLMDCNCAMIDCLNDLAPKGDMLECILL